MCLPTDSTFICTADRRIAIITAYQSSCAGISDIIRLLVHQCDCEHQYIGHSWEPALKQPHCASVGTASWILPWRGERMTSCLCFHAVCECFSACRQENNPQHLSNLPWSVQRTADGAHSCCTCTAWVGDSSLCLTPTLLTLFLPFLPPLPSSIPTDSC